MNPFKWFHEDVIIAARTSYPLTLMIGFNLFGNILLRKDCKGEPYPSWLFGMPLGICAYTYPGAVFSDLFFTGTLRALMNNNILIVFSLCYFLIQWNEKAFKFLTSKHVHIFITVWWLFDASRACLLFTERACAAAPVFSRAVWHAFIWCSAGPVTRQAEKVIRGQEPPALNTVQPDSLNFLKFPLVAMFFGQIFYTISLMYGTDCELFMPGGLNMVECGAKYSHIYAFWTYLPPALHLVRAYVLPAMESTNKKS